LPPAQPPAQLLSRPNPSPDAVHSRNPSKSTLTHDAVAAAVSHKHHSIIRVGADLIQFVYCSHSRLAADLIFHTKFYFRHDFRGLFKLVTNKKRIWNKNHIFREWKIECDCGPSNLLPDARASQNDWCQTRKNGLFFSPLENTNPIFRDSPIYDSRPTNLLFDERAGHNN